MYFFPLAEAMYYYGDDVKKEKPIGINVALYFDPPWDLLIELKNQYPNLPVNGVINPANGPGEAIDNEIAAEVLQLQAAGITVLGYTFTNNCQRPITDGISEDIDKYREWYNVDGIFYDELNCQEADLEYVETLDELANSRGALFTIGNPGTGIPESFIGILDNYIIYEDRGLPALSLIEERTFGLDKRHFSITAFGVPETEINSDYILALSELVQYIYITDDDLPNPYDTFSSYIDELFAILSQQADDKEYHQYDKGYQKYDRGYQQEQYDKGSQQHGLNDFLNRIFNMIRILNTMVE